VEPDRVARPRAGLRRARDRALGWSRHRRATLAQTATGIPGRAFNRLEARLAGLLDAAGVEYRWQYRLGPYVYDFLLPGRNLVEVHGTYWHADPRRYGDRALTPDQRRNRLHDLDKRLYAAARGYRLQVVWEADLTRTRVALADLLSA